VNNKKALTYLHTRVKTGCDVTKGDITTTDTHQKEKISI